MEASNLITIATTYIFVNIPKQLNGLISDDLLLDVERQVVTQYKEVLSASQYIHPEFEISKVHTKRGCIVVEISIGLSVVAVPTIYVILKDYKAFKESLYEIGKDVKTVWFKVRGKKESKSACVQKITVDDKQAIEEAIRELSKRNK